MAKTALAKGVQLLGVKGFHNCKWIPEMEAMTVNGFWKWKPQGKGKENMESFNGKVIRKHQMFSRRMPRTE